MTRLRVARLAERDLEDIWLYIACQDMRAARKWRAGMIRTFDLLARGVKIGPARKDLAPDLRYFPVGNYLIFYKAHPAELQVLRVIHGARNYGPEDFRG